MSGQSPRRRRVQQVAVQPRWVAGGALLTLAMVSAGSPALAFDVYRDSNGRIVKFDNRPVPVYLRTSGAPTGLSLAAQIKALQAAIEAWQSVTGSKAPLVFGGLASGPVRHDIEVHFSYDYSAIDGEMLAGTKRRAATDGTLLWAEIVLNARDVQWTSGPLTGQAQVTADLQGVLTHQLGHALGLGHSRDPQSTLYFYGTASALRTLSVDDQRGLRFVWPAGAATPTESSQCDACESDANCNGGTCLAWPDGARHCALPCADAGDCAVGTSCGTYGSGATAGQACLPNELHCKPDAAKAGMGGACASDLACNGYCMPATPVGFCTDSCDRCTGGVCAQTNLGGLCLVPGSGTLGERCWLPGDCKNYACAASITGGGFCTRDCGAGCPAGWRCDQGGSCVPEKSLVALPVGWPCESSFDCATGDCISMAGGRFAKVCAVSCEVATDCPDGTGCTPQGSATWCLPPAKVSGVAGLPCPSSGQCGPGLACDAGPLPNLPACRRRCDPFAATVTCDGGEICVFVGGPAGAAGACRPAVGGLQPLGATCSAVARCREDLHCADIAGEARCGTDCDRQSGIGCAGGETCLAVNGTAEFGVCAPVNGTTAKLVSPAPAKVDNFAARTISLPKVVAAAQWQPAATERAAPPSDGCATGRMSARWPSWLAVFAMATTVLGLRRRPR